MWGPIVATSSAGSCENVWMARATIPPTAPRQPACTAPTCPLEGCAIKIGTQSAVRAATPKPSTRAISASPSTSAIVSLTSDSRISCTCVPCTCRCSKRRSPQSPRLLAKRARFSQTASSSSPKWKPRLSVSYGATLTPPERVANECRKPYRSRRVECNARTWCALAWQDCASCRSTPRGPSPSPGEELA